MKSKTKSPHRFALYLIATILGYFVCGFVAQRVLAEEAPPLSPFESSMNDSIPKRENKAIGRFETAPGDQPNTIIVTATPEQLKAWTFNVDNSLRTESLRIDPVQNVTIKSGYVRRLTVGDALLTKKSVLALIAIMKQAAETKPSTREENIRLIAIASKIAPTLPKEDATELLYAILDPISRQVVTAVEMDFKIAELQKLADALAEEKAK